MEKYNKKRGRKRKAIIFDNSLLDQITNSSSLKKKEKLSFFKYVAFLSGKKKVKLKSLV